MSLLLALAALALGGALQVSNGFLHPAALLLLTLAFGLCALGTLLPPLRRLDRLGDEPVAMLLGLGLAFQFALLLTSPPGLYLRPMRSADAAPFVWGLAAAAILAGGAVSKGPWLGRAHLPLLLAVHFLLGCWMIRSSPEPAIDVYAIQTHAVEELLRGGNPYAMTNPNPYASVRFYGPGFANADRLNFGFMYPPLSLFLVVPAALIAGDVRYAQLLAFTVAGACLAYARAGRLGRIAAAVYLFSPRSFFVLEQAWTEPLVVALLGATVLAACRAPRLLPLGLGLLLASKQYLFLALPLLRLLGLSWRQVAAASCVALAVTLPLVLWDVGAFFHSAVAFPIAQPLRTDALSYVAWLAREGSGPRSAWPGFAVMAVASAAALARCPRTPAGFASALALAYLAFFAFNKQAFCNYYWFVLGALCAAIATVDSSEDEARRPGG